MQPVIASPATLDSDAERARQRRLGGTLAYVRIALNIGIALAYTPYLVHSLGKEHYGLFAIVGSLTSYLLLVDSGLSDSVVRWLVRFLSTKDTQGEHAFLGSMLSLYGMLAAFVVVAGVAVVLCVPLLFGATLSAADQRILQLGMIVIGSSAAIGVAGSPLLAALVAHERFVFLRVLEMGTATVVTALSVVVLWRGGGVVAVLIVTGAGTIGAVLARALAVRRYFKFAFRLRAVAWHQTRDVVAYAAPIFVSVVVELIFWRLDSILIGALLGAAAVAVYAIGVMFNKYFMSFATAISRVVMPDLVRRIDLHHDAAALTQRLIEVSRWQALVLLPVLAGLVLFGRHFIITWMGPDYALSYWVLVAALVPYAFELIGNVRNVVLQVKRLYWWRAGIFMAMALANVAATVWSLRHFGIVAAAACTGGGILLGYFGVAWVLARKVGIPIWYYLREVWRGIGVALTLACAGGAALDASLPGTGWFALLAKVGLFSALWLLLAWRFGMHPAERALVTTMVLRRRLAG